MTQKNLISETNSDSATAEVVRRFIAAFQQCDPTAFVDLVSEACVMESIQPAPNGTRYEGYEANLRFWQAMATDPNGSFEVEEVVVTSSHERKALNAVHSWLPTMSKTKSAHLGLTPPILALAQHLKSQHSGG